MGGGDSSPVVVDISQEKEVMDTEEKMKGEHVGLVDAGSEIESGHGNGFGGFGKILGMVGDSLEDENLGLGLGTEVFSLVKSLKEQYLKQREIQKTVNQDVELLKLERDDAQDKMKIVKDERDNIGKLLLERDRANNDLQKKITQLQEELHKKNESITSLKKDVQQFECQIQEQTKLFAEWNQDRRKDQAKVDQLTTEIEMLKNSTQHPIPLSKWRLTETDALKYHDLQGLQDVMTKNSQVITKVLVEDVNLCVVCLERKSTVAFSPCGHVCVCEYCAPKIKDACPMCRTKFTSKLKLFRA